MSSVLDRSIEQRAIRFRPSRSAGRLPRKSRPSASTRAGARPCGCRPRRPAGRPAASRRGVGSSRGRTSRLSLATSSRRLIVLAGPPPMLKTSPLDLVDPLQGALVDVDQVADPERVADLLAVAEDGERLAGRRGDAEPGDPSLVLDPELAGAVDAALAERPRSSARRSARSRARTGRPPLSSSRTGCGSRAARSRRRRTGGHRRRSGRLARRPRRVRGCRRPCWSSCRARPAGRPRRAARPPAR